MKKSNKKENKKQDLIRRYLTNGKLKEKKCSKCGKWLKPEEFPMDNKRIDKLYGMCRSCESKRQKIKNAKGAKK